MGVDRQVETLPGLVSDALQPRVLEVFLDPGDCVALASARVMGAPRQHSSCACGRP